MHVLVCRCSNVQHFFSHITINLLGLVTMFRWSANAVDPPRFWLGVKGNVHRVGGKAKFACTENSQLKKPPDLQLHLERGAGGGGGVTRPLQKGVHRPDPGVAQGDLGNAEGVKV